MTYCITDRDYALRYKMALEAIIKVSSGNTYDCWVNMRNIANEALKEKTSDSSRV